MDSTRIEDSRMVAGTIELKGRRFVVIPEEEYEHLRERAAVVGDVGLPELPRPDGAMPRRSG
jgi:hypothetical protein